MIYSIYHIYEQKEEHILDKIETVNKSEYSLKNLETEVTMGDILIDTGLTPRRYYSINKVIQSNSKTNNILVSVSPLFEFDFLKLLSKSHPNSIVFEKPHHVHLHVNCVYEDAAHIDLSYLPEIKVNFTHFEEIRELYKLPLSEILQVFTNVSMHIDCDSNPEASFTLLSDLDENKTIHHGYIELPYSLYSWKNSYSPEELHSKLESMGNIIDNIDYQLSFNDSSADDECIPCLFTIHNTNCTISLGSLVNEVIEAIEQALLKTRLLLSPKKPGFSIEFDFVDEIRVPCEQYLIYFKQFIMDLGVKVNNEITHDGDKTIFTVIPESKEQALRTIHDALEQYLELPRVISLPTFDTNKDLAVAQLEFAVTTLNAQLQLIQASHIAYQQKIKNQSFTLDVQAVALDELRIQNKKLTLSNSIEIKKDDMEPVIGEYLQVKKVEKLGICVDLPKIIRFLKRTYNLKK